MISCLNKQVHINSREGQKHESRLGKRGQLEGWGCKGDCSTQSAGSDIGAVVRAMRFLCHSYHEPLA